MYVQYNYIQYSGALCLYICRSEYSYVVEILYTTASTSDELEELVSMS